MRALTRTLLASLCLLSFACSAKDPGAAYSEGKHFTKVANPAKPDDPSRIKVEEFFWYGCGHCFNFEPEITAWKARKPADVDFIGVPASLGRPDGVLHQKAFYTAKALNISEKIHKPLFDAIHVRHQQLHTEAALGAFFNQQTGVLPDVFASTFNGFAVDSQVRRAAQLAKDYRIFSVPTVVVGGKYQTSAEKAGGSFADLTQVIDFLVEKVRKERKG